MLAATAAALFLCSGCYRPDVRTVEIEVEGINSRDCFTAIETAIKKSLLAPREAVGPKARIRAITWTEGSSTIAVTFNGRAMAIKNVEYAIAQAGFRANGVAPREEPPEGCGVVAAP